MQLGLALRHSYHETLCSFSGTSIVYPTGAAAAEAASAGDQALEALQAVITQPLPDRSKVTPSKRKMSSHGMMIVICDEMDQLMSTAQEVLYDLFFMPQVTHTRHDTGMTPHAYV